jgi:hypothetical protein
MFRSDKGTGVSPSPLNPVKLELAVLVIVGVLLWVLHRQLTDDPLDQLLLLGGYGLSAMAWLVMRTRRVLARRTLAADRDPATHEPE